MNDDDDDNLHDEMRKISRVTIFNSLRKGI